MSPPRSSVGAHYLQSRELGLRPARVWGWGRGLRWHRLEIGSCRLPCSRNRMITPTTSTGLLSSVVGLSSQVPADAFTAEILGTERVGNGVLIRDDGLVLTIGYLITEAEEVWLTTNTGRVVPGHVLAYDQVTGFGLVQALARLDIPVLPIGDSSRAPVGEHVVVAGAGGRARSVAARIVARQEFAGYWEYLLDEAIFTAPGHPRWGGTALIGSGGELLGIGSLQLQHVDPARRDRAA